MDLTEPSPMVNGAVLRRFQGQRVRTVVKVVNAQGGSVLGQLPDGGQITIRPMQGSVFQDQFVEIVGIVEAEGILREESSTPFGNNFDMSSYNQLCNLVHGDFKQLFY